MIPEINLYAFICDANKLLRYSFGSEWDGEMIMLPFNVYAMHTMHALLSVCVCVHVCLCLASKHIWNGIVIFLFRSMYMYNKNWLSVPWPLFSFTFECVSNWTQENVRRSKKILNYAQIHLNLLRSVFNASMHRNQSQLLIEDFIEVTISIVHLADHYSLYVIFVA